MMLPTGETLPEESRTRLLDVTDVANFLGISEYTVRRMAQAKRIRGVKFGRSWRFRIEDIETTLNNQENNNQGDLGGEGNHNR